MTNCVVFLDVILIKTLRGEWNWRKHHHEVWNGTRLGGSVFWIGTKFPVISNEKIKWHRIPYIFVKSIFFFQFHPYKFKTFRQTTYASQTSRRTDDMRWGMKSTTPNLVTEAYISSLCGAHWREEGAIIVKCFVYIDARSVMYKWRAYLRRRPCVLYIRKVEWRWYYVYRATTEGLILWQADICEIKMVDHICMMVESISTRRF